MADGMKSPREIGKFRVLELLGQGAMGQVFLAEDPLIDRKVAIKVMAAEGDDEARERFRNEARAAGQLSHPNIVQLYEFGFHRGQPYLVMEHLLGESLDRWLLREQPLKDKLAVLLDLCRAIAHAHSRGVLHRDVKPANLQVLPDRTCKLMDFGIARSRSVHLTATGMILGTPEFLAPEVLQDAGYSTSSDVYAIGVLAYQVLDGANPFHASTLEGCLTRVLTYEPPPLTEVCPDVPAALSELISSYMCKNPEQRPSTVEPLTEALRHLSDRTIQIVGGRATVRPDTRPDTPEAEATQTGVSTETPTIRGSTHARRGRRLSVAAIAAFALVGLLSATMLWRPWSKPDQLSEVAVPPSTPADEPAAAGTGPQGADSEGAGSEGAVARPLVDPGPQTADTSESGTRNAAGQGAERQAAPPPVPLPEEVPQDTPAADPGSGSLAALEPDSPPPPTAGQQAPPAARDTAVDKLLDSEPEPVADHRPAKTEPEPATEPVTEPATEPVTEPMTEPASGRDSRAAETSSGEAATRESPGDETSTPAPRIDRLAPMMVRRGSTAALQITGMGFGPETEVVVRRDGGPARGLRILRSKAEGASKLRVTLLIDRQLALGTYTLSVVNAGGRESNSVGLEVKL